MNFVYLSPHFPPNFHDFVRALHEQGVHVLGIGDQHWYDLPHTLQGWMKEYYKVDDMHDYDQLLRACGYFIHKHGRLDRLDSHSEYWLETEARLRTDFNIPGLRQEFTAEFKSKSRMKARYQAAGVPVARGALVATLEQGRALAAELGYPMVAKPDIGVGAAATYRIENDAQLVEFFARPPEVPYLFEEFISGTLVSFDGLADAEGKLVFCASHVFGRGIMEVVNEDDHMHYYSERSIPADLLELGQRVLAAFEVRERFFHFEFFRTAQGLVALEVNLRPPGGLTVNMFCYANNVDVFAEWARIVSQGATQTEFRRQMHVAYVARKHKKNYALPHEKVVEQFAELLAHHQPTETVFRSALGDYGYVLRGPELEPLRTAIGLIQG